MFQGLESNFTGKNQLMWDFEKQIHKKKWGTENHFDEKKVGLDGKQLQKLGSN